MALLLASDNGHLEVARLLLDSRADIHAADKVHPHRPFPHLLAPARGSMGRGGSGVGAREGAKGAGRASGPPLGGLGWRSGARVGFPADPGPARDAGLV